MTNNIDIDNIKENTNIITNKDSIIYPEYWILHTTKWKEIIVWWNSFTKVSISVWRDIKTKNNDEAKEKIVKFNSMPIPPDIIVDVSTYEEKGNELYKFLANNFDGVAWINPHLGLSYKRKWAIKPEQILERIEKFGKLWFGFIYIPPHINHDILEMSIKAKRLTTASLS